MSDLDDFIDIDGIAVLLDVSRGTVQLWNSKARGILPQPIGRRSNAPLWRREAIIQWAKDTGRWQRKRVNRFDVPETVA